ncbi:MAG: hypothetical protein M3Y84_13085 [Acidobacteriota bacterium]|nr:hypothetical protein [Acidobacteriota bacterium]
MRIVLKARHITDVSRRMLLLVCCITALGSIARSQSLDIASPSPIRANEVVGTITARDIGDSRLTDHFYAFTGTPGDVLITVETRNLNGDIDIFTAAGLRPLLKFTLYAGSSSSITKSIYLRTREDLLLRVEARTPNDDGGTYRLHFGGSFEPITSEPLLAGSQAIVNPPSKSITRSGKKGRRVSSVGARIEEPAAPEVATAPTSDSTPTESAEPGSANPAAAKTASRNSRARRPGSRRARTPEPEKTEESAAKNESESKPPAEGSETETKTTPARKRPSRRSATARRVSKGPETQEPADSGPRLIIETRDGTLVERYMNSLRRVTVENGQVVVVGKDGKLQRIQLANIVRMTISP